MAAPTWRNVDAPDFSGSMRGVESANAFLQQALTGARGLVDGVDKAMNANAEKAFVLELQKYSDAAALEQALKANPALGANVRRLSVDAIKSGGAQIDALLTREGTRLDNVGTGLQNQISGQNIKTNDITLAREGNRDANRDLLNGLVAAGQSGGPTAINAYLEKNPGVRQAVDFDKAIVSALGLANTNLDMTGKVQDQKITGVNFANSQEDRKRLETATSLAQTIKDTNATTDGVRAALQQIKDPLIRAFTAEKLGGEFQGLYGDVLSQAGYASGGSSGGGGGGAGNGIAFSGDENQAVQIFMGNVGGVESTNNPNAKNPNSSASGRFQFTKGTFIGTYMKEFGGSEAAARKAWETSRFDDGVQGRLMSRLTQENMGSLKGAGIDITPGSLYLAHFAGDAGARKLFENPNASARSILGEEVYNANKSVIGKKTAAELIGWAESKMGGAGPTNSSPAGRAVEVAARNSEDNNTFGTEDWMNGLGKNPPPRSAATALIKGGYFTGQPVDAVERLIRDFQKRTNNKASVKQITQILANAPPSTWGDDIDPDSRGLFGTGFLNLKGSMETWIDEQVTQFNSGDKERAAVRGADRSAIMAETAAAESRANAAYADYQLLSQSGRASAGEIAKAKKKVDDANVALQAARRRFGALGSK